MGFLKILASDVRNSTSKVLTAQYFACNKHLDVGSKEEGKDSSDHHDQEANRRLFRPIPIRDPTGDDETDDLACAGSVGQTRLPCRGDLVFRILFIPVPVLFVEDGGGVQVAEEC